MRSSDLSINAERSSFVDMKFIFEDPEHKLSLRETAIRATAIKTHSSLVGHRRRRQNLKATVKNHARQRMDTVSHSDRLSIALSLADPKMQASWLNKYLGVGRSSDDQKEEGTYLESSVIPSSNPAAPFSSTRYSSCSSLLSIDMFNTMTMAERRSFHFFLERTAHEWSGWRDEEMWSIILPRMASSSSVLRHGIAAIGAYHESLLRFPVHDGKDLLQFSVYQGRKAIETLSRQQPNESITTIMASYLVLMCFCSYLNNASMLDAAKALYNTFDIFREDTYKFCGKIPTHEWSYIFDELAPVADRSRSRFVQLVDSTAALRESMIENHRVLGRVLIPTTFKHPRHARDSLEKMLDSITYSAKEGGWPVHYLSPEAHAQVRTWKGATQKLCSGSGGNLDIQAIVCCLLIACSMGIITITTLRSVSEVDYDEYTETYRDIANHYQFLVRYEKLKGPQVRFGLDAGLLILVGSAAKQCRDPPLRRRLIELLEEGRTEAAATSGYYAMPAKCAQELEERGLDPPPTQCSDIPAANRVRLNAVIFYETSNSLQLQYLHFPYDYNLKQANYEVVWLQASNKIQCEPLVDPELTSDPPLAVFAASYVTWRAKGDVANPEYYTMPIRRFYFSIPKP